MTLAPTVQASVATGGALYSVAGNQQTITVTCLFFYFCILI